MLTPTYLIIDTNIWIYMTNGDMKDSIGKRIHIQVFDVLKNLVENGKLLSLREEMWIG